MYGRGIKYDIDTSRFYKGGERVIDYRNSYAPFGGFLLGLNIFNLRLDVA